MYLKNRKINFTSWNLESKLVSICSFTLHNFHLNQSSSDIRVSFVRRKKSTFPSLRFCPLHFGVSANFHAFVQFGLLHYLRRNILDLKQSTRQIIFLPLENRRIYFTIICFYFHDAMVRRILFLDLLKEIGEGETLLSMIFCGLKMQKKIKIGIIGKINLQIWLPINLWLRWDFSTSKWKIFQRSFSFCGVIFLVTNYLEFFLLSNQRTNPKNS